MTIEEIHQLQGRRIIRGDTARALQVGRLERTGEEHRADLEKIRKGLATRVRILANHDCCPLCRAVEGAYELEAVPALPMEGCSHPQGCRCSYAPVLDRFGP